MYNVLGKSLINNLVHRNTYKELKIGENPMITVNSLCSNHSNFVHCEVLFL